MLKDVSIEGSRGSDTIRLSRKHSARDDEEHSCCLWGVLGRSLTSSEIRCVAFVSDYVLHV